MSARWPERFAGEAARLRIALAEQRPAVEHIGSTAVPLPGKPIVDIQMAVDEPLRAVPALRELGYRHHGQGGVPDREYLTRRPPSGTAFNVHVFPRGSRRLRENRAIRDYLRAHPGEAERYARAKELSFARGFTDLLSYSDAKRERLAAVREAALRWELSGRPAAYAPTHC